MESILTTDLSAPKTERFTIHRMTLDVFKKKVNHIYPDLSFFIIIIFSLMLTNAVFIGYKFYKYSNTVK